MARTRSLLPSSPGRLFYTLYTVSFSQRKNFAPSDSITLCLVSNFPDFFRQRQFASMLSLAQIINAKNVLKNVRQYMKTAVDPVFDFGKIGLFVCLRPCWRRKRPFPACGARNQNFCRSSVIVSASPFVNAYLRHNGSRNGRGTRCQGRRCLTVVRIMNKTEAWSIPRSRWPVTVLRPSARTRKDFKPFLCQCLEPQAPGKNRTSAKRFQVYFRFIKGEMQASRIRGTSDLGTTRRYRDHGAGSVVTEHRENR